WPGLQDWPRKSGYQTFDALRFWSLWPPRFASARKSRWGSMVPHGAVGQLFADDSPRTHPRLGPERTLVDASKVHVGRNQRPAIRKTGFMEYRARPTPNYSALMLAARITLPHFSASSLMSLPKSEGEPAITVPPRSASRALSWGSARAALISLLSLLTISAGVPVGAPTPYQPLD